MELNAIITALRRAWWILVLSIALGVVAALTLSLSSTPQYTSRSELFISTTGAASTAEAIQGNQLSADRVASYARLLSGQKLAERVIRALDLSLAPGDLAQEVSASVVPNTVMLEFTVTDSSPERAQQIAEEMGRQFVGLVSELEPPIEGDRSPIRVTVVREPDLPGAASSPRTARNLLVGAVLGLVVGVGAALARTQLDRSVRDPEVAAELAGAPLIGVILRDPVLMTQHVFTGHGGAAAEGYRLLRTNLQFLNVDEPPKVIMISSAVPGEGKTTLVVNLGLALAEAGRTVTIVEADLRRPRVIRYLSMIGGVGLTNILAGKADLDDVVQTYGDGSLSVLGAGPTPPNPGELLASVSMVALIDELRAKNDFVLIDSPPVLPVADASGLAAVADGVVLSVRYGSTTKDLVRRTVATLDQVGARRLGVVLNIVPPKAEINSGYSYGYEHQDATDD